MNDAQREHRLPDLVRLADIAGRLRRLDEVVHERVDPHRDPVGPSNVDLLARQVASGQDPEAHRVVDVVVDVGDAVDEAHDLPLERGSGSRSPVWVRMPSHTSCVRLRRPCDRVTNARCGGTRLSEALAEHLVERVLARVSERACGPCRGRARSPRRGPRSAAAPARRRARSQSSRACASCGCDSGRRRGSMNTCVLPFSRRNAFE